MSCVAARLRQTLFGNIRAVLEQTTGIVLIAGAALGCLYVTLGRVFGFYRPTSWAGGGEATLVGDLSLCLFVGSLGAIVFSPFWVLPALAAWITGYISQRRANLRHNNEEEQLRKTNALNHPRVFDNQPPENIDDVVDETLDLFDAGACTYVGSVLASDIRVLVNAFSDMPDQGTNDIFLIPESLELIPESQLTQDFTTMLNVAFEDRNYLVLRWLPSREMPNNN